MPTTRPASLLACLWIAGAAACAHTSGSVGPQGDEASSGPAVVVDLPVAQPPFATVEANWKDRIDQPYVYFDLTGSYTNTGRRLTQLADEARAQGIRPSGAPFALFYDDPGQTPVEHLRSRVCLPVAEPALPRAPLLADVLPSRTVVYAYAGGRYTDLPRAYHGLYAFMGRMNWAEQGPIREIYLVQPTGTNDAELVAEIQIPVGWAQ